MLKALLASASLSFAFLLLPPGSVGPIATTGTAGLSTAHSIELEIDLGGGDEEDGDDGADGTDGTDDDDDGDEGGDGPVSCSRGQRAVEKAGFKSVRARSCGGAQYRYSGRRNGENFEIRVNSRNGRIVSVRKR